MITVASLTVTHSSIELCLFTCDWNTRFQSGTVLAIIVIYLVRTYSSPGRTAAWRIIIIIKYQLPANKVDMSGHHHSSQQPRRLVQAQRNVHVLHRRARRAFAQIIESRHE
jgi:hypothetical protein